MPWGIGCRPKGAVRIVVFSMIPNPNQRTNDSKLSHQETPAKVDWLYRVLLGLTTLVAAWLLAMPFVPAISQSLLNRYHLRTERFVAWAIQQPIPPMYSCRNTVKVFALPRPPESNETAELIHERTINHFPTRDITFANSRLRYLRDREAKRFVLRSTYRGQAIESVYEVRPVDETGWVMKLVECRDHE